MVLLVMTMPLLAVLAVMTVVPEATLLAIPLRPLLRPVLIVATLVLDDFQVTASEMSWLLDILA